MSAPRAIRGCLLFWAAALVLICALIGLINVVEVVAHSWW